MGIFSNKKSDTVDISQSQLLQNKYTSACNNILLVIVLTVINIVLLVTNSNTYFLFSAYIPFALADLGMYVCGMYPAEFYTEELAGAEFLPQSVFIVMLGIAAVILILYVLSWVFSKKQKCGWLIFALVFFSIDTLAMFALNGIVLDSVIDYAIHVWVIVSLVSGIVSYSKLKKLPEVPEAERIQEPVSETAEVTVADGVTADISEETV